MLIPSRQIRKQRTILIQCVGQGHRRKMEGQLHLLSYPLLTMPSAGGVLIIILYHLSQQGSPLGFMSWHQLARMFTKEVEPLSDYRILHCPVWLVTGHIYSYSSYMK